MIIVFTYDVKFKVKFTSSQVVGGDVKEKNVEVEGQSLNEEPVSSIKVDEKCRKVYEAFCEANKVVDEVLKLSNETEDPLCVEEDNKLKEVFRVLEEGTILGKDIEVNFEKVLTIIKFVSKLNFAVQEVSYVKIDVLNGKGSNNCDKEFAAIEAGKRVTKSPNECDDKFKNTTQVAEDDDLLLDADAAKIEKGKQSVKVIEVTHQKEDNMVTYSDNSCKMMLEEVRPNLDEGYSLSISDAPKSEKVINLI